MAYEYESKLRDYLIGHTNVNPKFDGFEILKSLDELKEVYQKAKLLDDIVITTKKRLSEQERKAKAWDNYIAEVRERGRFSENTEDDIDRKTQKVINYYMEDE